MGLNKVLLVLSLRTGAHCKDWINEYVVLNMHETLNVHEASINHIQVMNRRSWTMLEFADFLNGILLRIYLIYIWAPFFWMFMKRKFITVMVNKTINHLSPQIWHQTQKRKRKTTTYDIGNPGQGFEQA
jgi:hypothetical protein